MRARWAPSSRRTGSPSSGLRRRENGVCHPSLCGDVPLLSQLRRKGLWRTGRALTSPRAPCRLAPKSSLQAHEAGALPIPHPLGEDTWLRPLTSHKARDLTASPRQSQDSNPGLHSWVPHISSTGGFDPSFCPSTLQWPLGKISFRPL